MNIRILKENFEKNMQSQQPTFKQKSYYTVANFLNTKNELPNSDRIVKVKYLGDIVYARLIIEDSKIYPVKYIWIDAKTKNTLQSPQEWRDVSENGD